MKKLLFVVAIISLFTIPTFTASASFWTNLLDMFRAKKEQTREQIVLPTPTQIPTSITIPPKPIPPTPSKVPSKFKPTTPAVSIPIIPKEDTKEAATISDYAVVATSTVSAPTPVPEPTLLAPGSISFTVSSPVSSVKSGTLTITSGTRVTLYWDVPDAAYKCTNSWGYPLISQSSNNERGTDVFPDTTTVYSISCVNSYNEILDIKSIKVEVVPLTSASVGFLPILSPWELLKALFVWR